MDIIKALAGEFSLKDMHVRNMVQLLEEGNTVPFIARYRKEMTGSVDDQLLRALADRLVSLRALDARREVVLQAIAEAGALTPELERRISGAKTMTELEDLYRPYKKKRRTRAAVAREKGLLPLAEALLLQSPASPDPEILAEEYVNPENGVEDVQAALLGARDILAEMVSDEAQLRARLREDAHKQGVLCARAAKAEEDSVYRDYFEYEEAVFKIADHRVLALDRGEREGALKVTLSGAEEVWRQMCVRAYVKGGAPTSAQVAMAAADGYDRLIAPSIEREVRSQLTERAHGSALKVFSQNLRQLLLTPPLRGRVTLGLDPGYRTGVKFAVVDEIGRVLDTGVIYPTPPRSDIDSARFTVLSLVHTYGVSLIAIGNGTASRETERFAAQVILDAPGLSYLIVSEAGASVYSASQLAAQEFPEYDVALRSAVSIARRTQDPMAELVKIDPKAIGVGQYQHDLNENRLDEALVGVVEDCVSSVGVDVNTASKELLSRVAGIGPALAQNVVAYRQENGAFPSRAALQKVPRLGPRAFEQCAGFLRVPGGRQVLDNTGVHPESYGAAQALLTLCGYTLEDVAEGRLSQLESRVEEMGYANAAARIGVGEPTLRDIAADLLRPGRDPRDALTPPVLRSDVLEISDIRTGMQLMGTVRNVTDFGAFVDIGVHQDGLVHISRLAGRFVKHPCEVVKVGDVVNVWVIDVDTKRGRIALSMVRPA